MADVQHVVLAEWDADARVWFVKATDIPGLIVEAATFEEFIDVVQDVAPDLLESEEQGPAPISIAVRAEAIARAAPNGAAA